MENLHFLRYIVTLAGSTGHFDRDLQCRGVNPMQISPRLEPRTAQPRRWLSLVAFAVLALLLTSLGMASVQAQEPAPDPLRRAFDASRAALEEKFSTDLSLVQRWTFAETEFVNGIDSCLRLPEGQQPRQQYWGWRFLIVALDGRRYEARSSFDSTIIVACDEVTEDIGGAAAAPAAPPVVGAGAVGGFELGGHVLDFNANTINLMRRAGMNWVKKQIQYVPGADPGITAGAIQAAHANGFKILLGIVGIPNQMGDFDSYIAGYAQFVGGVAALGADAIEVWNEPNIDREWPAGQINGANYTRLLAAAYNAIKAANPNTMVISGAPAPTGFFGAAGCAEGGCNDDVFMQQMAAAGAANYMDCVGLHYNEGIVPPNQTGNDPRGNYPTYFFGSMLNRGYAPFGGRPVCFTELGYLSPEGFDAPLPPAFSWAQNTTVAQQASWLAGAVAAAAQSGRVRLLIVWNVDFPFWGADPAGGYAMFRPNESCPACDALGAVMGAQ